ncbi:recombination mediator RecR [Patescibacteria group bacterium]
MKALPPSIQRLIKEFNKLPGIGSKTSERFVFHLLRQPKTEIEALAESLQATKDAVRLCTECYTFAEEERCAVCVDSGRDRATICVVAEPKDVIALEKATAHEGVYHVLGGVIDHAAGVGPDQLRVDELLARIDANSVTEVIIATNPDMEGETTALYLAQQLKDKPVTVTKIARGLPVGADLEFADEVTLGSALQDRRKISDE